MRDLARFVAQMEIVLDLYSSQHSARQPLICMDEAAIQLTGHLYEPIAMQSGHDAKEDYHYTSTLMKLLHYTKLFPHH